MRVNNNESKKRDTSLFIINLTLIARYFLLRIKHNVRNKTFYFFFSLSLSFPLSFSFLKGQILDYILIYYCRVTIVNRHLPVGSFIKVTTRY